jgi:hypothetical protein
MNVWFKKTIFILILTFAVVFVVPALESSIIFEIGNLNFAKDRTASTTTFDGSVYPWGFSISGIQPISETLGMEIGFLKDPVLRNVAFTLFNYNNNFVSIGVGPVFGFFNSKTAILQSGLATNVKFEFPGLLFIQFNSENTIGGRLVENGDYIQERSDIILGFYVKNAICSLNLLSKKYTQKSGSIEIIDAFSEYSFKTDIYKKNVPYNILISFAYQNRTKTFTSDPIVKHTLNSVILGTTFNIFVSNMVSITTNLESNVYTFGQNALVGVFASDIYLFKLYTGVNLSLGD